MAFAYQSNLQVLTGLTAGADLRTHQFKFVKIGANPKTVVLNDTLGGEVVGVLQNAPNTGEAAQVAVEGSISKIVLGATIPAGSTISSTNVGLAKGSALGEVINGTLLIGADANELGSILLQCKGED